MVARRICSAGRLCALMLGMALPLAGVALAQPVPLPPLSPTAVAAGAQITREQGFEFVTVGHAGNAQVPPVFQSFPVPTPGLGRVDYDYRISRAEVTYGQYFEFVRAYAPLFDITDPIEFRGLGIRSNGGNPRDPNSYFIRPGWENAPAEMGWRFAARFTNWLHNDRGTTTSAFLTGAYDASTFTPDPPGSPLNDNTSRLPGARFFIPTQSEWTKAMYYDPNRFGPGLSGYWPWPTTSVQFPTVGPPGTPGAETNATLGLTNPPHPVASYPSIMSPWGLFDGSGGAREWLGEGDGASLSRFYRGSSQRGIDLAFDHIQITDINFVHVASISGVRIAAMVPSPATSCFVGLVCSLTFLRRRR